MFLFFRPTPLEIDEFLQERQSDEYSYPEVGGTSLDRFPTGYNIDHNRILLGSGRPVFEVAKDAIRSWTQFKVPGVEIIHSNTPIEPGRTVAMLAEHLGFYSLNSCRIVYVLDEPGRFGFAYGTLTEHVEVGEERFTVEFHESTREIWYDILAFSRAGHLLVKLGYPYGRYLQKQFAIHSKAAMLRAAATSS
ncbi:MAG TPA: DUF1990 domain-containing protein [Pyrinomonadaceae bacterium]|nr:DUF1990 domain-containing protein [Pyrinomonadaceae bacterium]